MTLGSCMREKEVADLLHRGHWPQACPADLRAHVDACRSCSELVLVTQAFQRARANAAGAAHLESPGVLWWRAQLRRRNAAIERIGKPILGAQIFALAIALVVAAGFLASQAKHGLRWMSWLADLPGSLHLDTLWPAAPSSLDGSLLLLVPILATVALVSGVVVYLASEKQ
ncbi:MAG: hypothetical protein WAM85_07830 [Terracidiphilus sp.]